MWSGYYWQALVAFHFDYSGQLAVLRDSTLSSVALSLAAGYGIFLLYTALAMNWRGLGLSPAVNAPRHRLGLKITSWLAEAGLSEVSTSEFVSVTVGLALFGGAIGYLLFGGVVPPAMTALGAASIPVASYRGRRQRRREAAREAWPRMLEELRLLTGSLGRSIPQALFEAGRRGPKELQPAFAAAEREWLVSTDFLRTIESLKENLSDPTADAALETLLVAHEVGGSDLDRRLAALVADRTADLEGRKDAMAKQAGVRFARRFVLAVPIGMAIAGLSIGTGRAAYETTAGQTAVAIGVASMALCWIWAGRLLRLPETERVFGAPHQAPR